MRQAGGANVILDIVGGPNIEKNFKAAHHDARIIQLAFALGSKVEINLMPVMLKRLTLHRLDAAHAAARVQGADRARARSAGLAADCGRQNQASRSNAMFPLAEAAQGARADGIEHAPRKNRAGGRLANGAGDPAGAGDALRRRRRSRTHAAARAIPGGA